jgi:ubiquinone/menaquinone biosynthesis C-methylase UbiE
MCVAQVIDPERVKGFAKQLVSLYSGGGLTLMIDLGGRTGLFDSLAEGPGTSDEIASRAGLKERPVREWLGSMAVAGIVTYDAATHLFTLPPEHAMCLTGDSAFNLAPMAQLLGHSGKLMAKVAESFRTGAGVSYSEYQPEFTELTDVMGRRRYDAMLIGAYLPLAQGLPDRLEAGIRVADVGCGSGHCLNLMAAAFPRSTFVGYDIDEEGIARGHAEAKTMGLANTKFVAMDAGALPPEPKFDLITAFDAIHDQTDPSGVLRRIHQTMAPDSIFFMLDIRASSNLEDNVGKATAPWIYSTSVMHCLQVSLAGGGAGLGAAWGEQKAREMLTEAGFSRIDTARPPMDAFNLVYICRS